MENIIKKAIEGGYNDGIRMRIGAPPHLVSLDQDFWQALGKACGWKPKETEIKNFWMDGWLYHATRFHNISLTEGWDKAVAYLENQITTNPMPINKEKEECSCECHGYFSKREKCSMCESHHPIQEKEEWEEKLEKHTASEAHLYVCNAYSEGQKCCLDEPWIKDFIRSAISEAKRSERENTRTRILNNILGYFYNKTVIKYDDLIKYSSLSDNTEE